MKLKKRIEWGEMYQSLNQKALSQLDQILRRNPLDVHALSLSIVACKATSYKTQTSARLQALRLISPEA